MKKIVIAGIASVAFAGLSVPALAVTDLGSTNLNSTDVEPGPTKFYSPFTFAAAGGTYSADPSGFKKSYTFDFPTAGVGAGSATASLVGGANTIFKSVTLNGAAFDLSVGNTQAVLLGALVNAGTNTLEINFDILDVTKTVGFTGDLSAAVPEPATWGMMILGFGLIGGALRSRKKVSVRYV